MPLHFPSHTVKRCPIIILNPKCTMPGLKRIGVIATIRKHQNNKEATYVAFNPGRVNLQSRNLAEEDKKNWALYNVFGADDPNGTPSIFASEGHGALGLNIRSLTEDPDQLPPQITIKWKSPYGEKTETHQTTLPLGLIPVKSSKNTTLAAGDDKGAIRLYKYQKIWMALSEAKDIELGQKFAYEVAEKTNDEKLINYFFNQN